MQLLIMANDDWILIIVLHVARISSDDICTGEVQPFVKISGGVRVKTKGKDSHAAVQWSFLDQAVNDRSIVECVFTKSVIIGSGSILHLMQFLS